MHTNNVLAATDHLGQSTIKLGQALVLATVNARMQQLQGSDVMATHVNQAAAVFELASSIAHLPQQLWC
jgi:hypothetical protein